MCEDHEFRCENNKCINATLQCNEVNDCGDYSDEGKNCKGKLNYFGFLWSSMISILINSFSLWDVIIKLGFSGIRCNNDYPYAFMWGKYCCKNDTEDIIVERNKPGHIEGCDGGTLSIDSVCCTNNDMIKCSSEEGCRNKKGML